MRKVKLFFVISALIIASIFVVPKVVNAGPIWPPIIGWCIVCIEGWICLSEWCEKSDGSGAYTKGGCMAENDASCYWGCKTCGISSRGSGPLDVEHSCGNSNNDL